MVRESILASSMFALVIDSDKHSVGVTGANVELAMMFVVPFGEVMVGTK